LGELTKLNRLKRNLLVFFTFIGGAYFFLEFALPEEISGIKFGAYHEGILMGLQIMGAMAIGMGLISIFRVHGSRIIKRSSGAFYSAALLISFILMLSFQIGSIIEDRKISKIRREFSAFPDYLAVIAKEKNQKDPTKRIELLEQKLRFYQPEISTSEEAKLALTKCEADVKNFSIELQKGSDIEGPIKQFGQSLGVFTPLLIDSLEKTSNDGLSKKGESFLSNGFFIPLGSAMFALLAFYIATAAFRSFRIRSVESSLLMITAIIVMLGQIPQGSIYISEELPTIRKWILENISTPAFRAISIGSAVAGLAMAIRMWLSLEKGPISGED